jgi:hypothetical protein
MTQAPDDDEQDFTPPTEREPVPAVQPTIDPKSEAELEVTAPAAVPTHGMPLADELGVEDIYIPIMGKDGKIFCTAGRDAPIAEFEGDFLILHPPQMPLDVSDRGEAFTNVCDERGILLNELGEPKKIPAATYMGCPIYIIGEQRPGTLKNYVVVLTPEGTQHSIYYVDGERLTYTEIYALRNKSADGELAIFDDEIVCDL